MAAIGSDRSYGTDRFIDIICAILTTFCSISLVLLVTENIKSLPIPEYLVTAIAFSAIAVTFIQFFRHKHNTETVNQKDKINMSVIHTAVNDVSMDTNQSGSRVLIKAMSNRFLSHSSKLSDIDELHRYIDDCASTYDVSGSHLLLLALLQRFEHVIANQLLNISSWIIKVGRVHLEFLHNDESPQTYFRDIWLEDVETMPTVRMRTKFGLARIVDAFGIVCDYGMLAGLHARCKTLAQRLRLMIPSKI